MFRFLQDSNNYGEKMRSLITLLYSMILLSILDTCNVIDINYFGIMSISFLIDFFRFVICNKTRVERKNESKE